MISAAVHDPCCSIAALHVLNSASVCCFSFSSLRHHNTGRQGTATFQTASLPQPLAIHSVLKCGCSMLNSCSRFRVHARAQWQPLDVVNRQKAEQASPQQPFHPPFAPLSRIGRRSHRLSDHMLTAVTVKRPLHLKTKAKRALSEASSVRRTAVTVRLYRQSVTCGLMRSFRI